MKNLNQLQYDAAGNLKISQGEIDKVIIKFELELKDLTLSFIQRRAIEADIRRLKSIKHSIRSLEVMDSFYNPNGMPIQFE